MEVTTTSDNDVLARVEDKRRDANGDEDTDVSDVVESETSVEIDEGSESGVKESGATENAHKIVEEKEETTNPLVKSSLPSNKSFDRQVKALITSSEAYIYFDQWKSKLNDRSTVTRLRLAFEQLLPRLMGARDYAGAAKVLGVIYHRFVVTPGLCIEASLEILRRQEDYRSALLSFYEAAAEVQHVDKMSILKEKWLFHIAHGEFYEAYHMYRDTIEPIEEATDDARLLANFGILCYWLIFVESKTLRDRFVREHTDYDDEEDDHLDAADNTNCGASGGVESVIESNYCFKTPIGVHVLYQHASNALRRAVALSPNSAMFVEYYVQLLVLVGDIQPACDYLEAFFHMNPDDPHGSRMLAQFLEHYYPDSVDAQVAAFARWMKNDPSCSYPLEKVLELSSAGVVSSVTLTRVLVEALDTCGSDLYVEQSPDMALTLWRNLAELLAAMDEDVFLMDQIEGGATDPSSRQTIADVGAQRAWWKRVFFVRPSTYDEAVAVAKRDSNFMQVSIYRAVVSDHLFPGQLPLTEALRLVMASPGVISCQDHVRLFKSFFPSVSSTKVTNAAYTPFSDMSFMHVTDDCKQRVLPVYKGSSTTVRVIDRESIVEREAASEQAKVAVTRTGKAKEVDEQFVEELYEALESEVVLSGSSDQLSRRKRKADAAFATSALIPGFVRMVEEEVYNDPKAAVRHIYSAIYQKLRRSDMLVPTSKVVARCANFFRNRLKKNIEAYGHSGMMIRHEEFIAMYLHRQRTKGIYEVTTDAAKAAVEEMKRVLPSTHPHFPNEDLVEETMRRKTAMFARQRRLGLMHLKQTLKPVLQEIVYVVEKVFVDAVHSVCVRNGLSGVITRLDIARTVQNILPMHYHRVVQRMPVRFTQKLFSPTFRKNCNTLEAILQKLKREGCSRTAEEVQVLFWVERHEALHGPIDDIEEDTAEGERKDDTSSSDSSTNSESGGESVCENDNSEDSAEDDGADADSGGDFDEHSKDGSDRSDWDETR
ncbi:unnamed protein product [Hyaloperonospora brassicae]|uniref:Uncharacterized protein n=1 Tax=Hyaloperonospora brassicae TaxID=162125 RepID=A0AAV0TR20_HYABA|nr:unnamed protein product [Hyaloperonospora brassicae]